MTHIMASILSPIKDYVQIVKSDEVSVYQAVIRYIYDEEQREHAEQGTEVYFALEDMSKDCVDIGSKIILWYLQFHCVCAKLSVSSFTT